MTQRVITFDGSPQHKLYFKLIFEAFRSRGSAPPDQRVPKAERRMENKILRQLKSISEPVGEAPKDGDPDMRALQLSGTGGVMELEQPEFARLQKFIEDTQWQSLVSDVETDLEDWFDTAEKVDSK